MAQYVYDMAVVQYSIKLRALKQVLGNAREFAKQRNFDESLLLGLRAAPDMFPLLKQVQIATDLAKAAGGKLTSKAAPFFDDKETSFDELFSRIDKTLDYLNQLKVEDFSDYQNKKISFPWFPGHHLSGKDYFDSHSVPNFYFHLTAAYMLLRSAGVNLGKKDFVGELNWLKD